MAKDVLAATGQRSLGLSSVRALTGEAVTFEELAHAIEKAAEENPAESI